MSTNASICFTNDDIKRWTDNGIADVRCLNKHLHILTSKIQQITNDLKSKNEQCTTLDETNRRLQTIIDDDRHAKRILQELHEKKIVDLTNDMSKQITMLNEQIQLLTTNKCQLEQDIQRLNDVCRTKTVHIEQLGRENTCRTCRSMLVDVT
jgi:chromosome segregation ATPase